MLGNVFTVYELYAGEETLGTNERNMMIYKYERWTDKGVLVCKVFTGWSRGCCVRHSTCWNEREKYVVGSLNELNVLACWTHTACV